jgi:DNA-binding response OmpR family regulator
MRILIADDHAPTCRLMENMLPTWGYEPVVAHDGLATLDLLRRPDAPRLVLLDWMMPGLDGVQVCRELREDQRLPYTYIIMLTGHGGRTYMVTGLEAGADDFLLKPVDTTELRARLKAASRIVLLQEQLSKTQRELRDLQNLA